MANDDSPLRSVSIALDILDAFFDDPEIGLSELARRIGVAKSTAHRTCGAASEIVSVVAETAHGALRAPIKRVCALNMQIPFSPALEKLMYPTPERIRAAVLAVCGEGDGNNSIRRIG